MGTFGNIPAQYRQFVGKNAGRYGKAYGEIKSHGETQIDPHP